MTLPLFIAICSTVIFGVISIILSYREEKMKQMISDKEHQQKKQLYEAVLLKQMHDRIGYSPDTERVIDVIAHSLDNLFTYSTVSTIFINDDKLVFKAQVKEPVSRVYVEKVKNMMLRTLGDLTHAPLPHMIDEHVSGVALNQNNFDPPQSISHIPFIVKNRVVGLITLSSTQEGLYNEKEMSLLHQITGLASFALSRLDDTLTTEKSKFISMVSDLGDGVFMVDTNKHLNIINKAAKEYLGIHKENPSIIDVMSALPNTYDFAGKIELAILENEPIDLNEIQVGDRLLRVSITPVHDASHPSKNKVIGASVMLHDITTEKSVLRMKEDFTNIIVHELRSPLTSIKASSDLLISSKNLTDEERTRLTHIISLQSRQLLTEISLILDAAKLEAGIFTLEKEKTDIKMLINEIVDVYTPQARDKSVELTIDMDQSIPDFLMDPQQIIQVMNNIISNSMKFTNPGGKISIHVAQTHQKVMVTVADNGTGIPKDKQHLLFTRFSQLRIPNAQIGTGLGLYIVKGIIEAHGGTIDLDSAENKGTTVTFTLPLLMAPLQAVNGHTTSANGSHKVIN